MSAQHDASTKAAAQRVTPIWNALGHNSEAALDLRLRADLMQQLLRQILSWGLSVPEAANRLSISPERLHALLHGHIGRFSLNDLIHLTIPAGLHLELKAVSGE